MAIASNVTDDIRRAELRQAAFRFPAAMHAILFGASAQTLSQLGSTRLGVKLGFTSVLHTWARDLSYHPHVHCVVSGGGLRETEGLASWVDATRYLFPVSILRRVYRAKFFDHLDAAHREGRVSFGDDPRSSGRALASLKRKLRAKSWVVHVDAPEDRPVQQALRYLGRYVYRVAITDARLLSTGPTHVTFRTRGERTCRLDPVEFVRRLALHVLPRGFRKVRHYGLYAPSNAGRCARARALVGGAVPDRPEEPASPDTTAEEPPRRCRECGGPMLTVPVAEWLDALDDRTWQRQYQAMLPWVDL